MAKVPSAPDRVVKVWAVFTFFTVTWAAATTAPCWSVTSPAIEPVAPSGSAVVRVLAVPAPTTRQRISHRIEAVLWHISSSGGYYRGHFLRLEWSMLQYLQADPRRAISPPADGG